MEIKHSENAHKGSFYVEENNSVLAELSYSFAGADKLILDQTNVSIELKGMKIGNSLIEAAVNYSRAKNIKIVPLCPFAKDLIESTPEFRDVLIQKDLG
ncbi:MAG: GNAT family N-acetyltransferase [Daejeonella sp.]|uniref:GNAT family N-acetyltransferase n=1 Tax=Daejeonella sp. TaxID=2805397 RepID=UPI002735D881|nr:GNAT family N-acetyltransferase [Daejeonella sp.]MDP3466770.1 GNAT family N-acetyltransferase [Daejeonella sp.]